MKVSVTTSVHNGKFKRNLTSILQAVQQFEGKECEFTLSTVKKQRSNPQNRYYFGCLLVVAKEAIKDTWGEVWDIDKTHEFFKAKFLYTEKINEQSGEIVKLPKSTTENTTTQQEDYHEEIRRFLKEWFGCDVPLPNESTTLDFND